MFSCTSSSSLQTVLPSKYPDGGVRLSAFVKFAKPYLNKDINSLRSIIKNLTKRERSSFVDYWAAHEATTRDVNPIADVVLTYVSTYKVKDFLDALENDADGAANPERFVWLDFLSQNLHDTDWDIAEWVHRLVRINEAEIVIFPFDDPKVLHRTWSIYEYFEVIVRKIPYIVRTPKSEQIRFEQRVGASEPLILRLLNNLTTRNLTTSKSFSLKDKEAIFSMAEGHAIHFIEEAANQICVNWLLSTCKRVALSERGIVSLNAFKSWADIEMRYDRIGTVLEITEKGLIYARLTFGHVSYENLVWTRTHALTFHLLKEYEQSAQLYLTSVAIVKSLYVNDLSNVKVGLAIESAARFIQMNGYTESAIRLYEEGLRCVESIKTARVDVLALHAGLALCCFKMHRYDSALEHYTKELSLSVEMYGKKSKQVADCEKRIKEVKERGLQNEVSEAWAAIMLDQLNEQEALREAISGKFNSAKKD